MLRVNAIRTTQRSTDKRYQIQKVKFSRCQRGRVVNTSVTGMGRCVWVRVPGTNVAFSFVDRLAEGASGELAKWWR